MESITKFSKQEWFTLCSIGSANFFISINESLLSPFYPPEAEKKGMSASMYGLVFGIYKLVPFISCPIAGKYMARIGGKLMLWFAMFLAGLSAVSFGLLDLVDSYRLFVFLSFTVISVMALSYSGISTANCSMIAATFPTSMSTTFAMLEIFTGVGSVVGPTVGGSLFELGGYICLYAVDGGLLILAGLFIFFTLPDIDKGKLKDIPQVPGEIFSALRLPPLLLNAAVMVTEGMTIGYFVATLEPHVRPFGLSPVNKGLLFAMDSLAYALSAPLVGKLCERLVDTKKMMCLGFLLTIIGTVIIGPLPFIPAATTLWMVCVGILFYSIGFGCKNVASYVDSIRSAVELGLPDDIRTYGIVTGLWASTYALGGAIGPAVGGVLLDTVGFRKGSIFVIVLQVIMFIVMTTYICTEKRSAQKSASTIDDNSWVGHGASWSQETDAHALTADDSTPLTDPAQRTRYGSTETRPAQDRARTSEDKGHVDLDISWSQETDAHALTADDSTPLTDPAQGVGHASIGRHREGEKDS